MRTETELTLAITAEAAPVKAVATDKAAFLRFMRDERRDERAARTIARAEKLNEEAKAKDEEAKAKDEASKKVCQDELSNITLGMTPSDLAQKMIDEFTVTLNSLTTGRANAITAAEKLLKAFEECSTDLASKKIDGTTYIANCIIALTESEAELTKPQTFTEKFHHGLISAIRALLNLFDRLYTWISGATQTMAENEDRKPYFPVPVTALGKEVIAFTNGLSVLAKDVAKDRAAAALATVEKEAAKVIFNAGRPTRPTQEASEHAARAPREPTPIEQQRAQERRAVKQLAHENRTARRATATIRSLGALGFFPASASSAVTDSGLAVETGMARDI